MKYNKSDKLNSSFQIYVGGGGGQREKKELTAEANQSKSQLTLEITNTQNPRATAVILSY